MSIYRQLRACQSNGGWIWAIATGSRYAGSFSALCAVAGVTFIAATVWYSRRA
jgi:hypothetical protein